MLLSHIITFIFVALVSARSSRVRRSPCEAGQGTGQSPAAQNPPAVGSGPTTGGTTPAAPGTGTGTGTGSTDTVPGTQSHYYSNGTSSNSNSGTATPGGASNAAPVGGTLIASFTQYGAGDSFGSGNCNSASAACGWYSNPGFNAAVSQNLYGAGPGAGAGTACGKCYALTATKDAGGAPMPPNTGSIIVKVNNLCPAQGNPLCSQPTLQDKNSVGANVNFDLCKDDKAASTFFGSVGMATGTAVEVSCGSWTGSPNLTS